MKRVILFFGSILGLAVLAMPVSVTFERVLPAARLNVAEARPVPAVECTADQVLITKSDGTKTCVNKPTGKNGYICTSGASGTLPGAKTLAQFNTQVASKCGGANKVKYAKYGAFTPAPVPTLNPSPTSPDCVKLSIPIFAGDTCIDNTAPGGAIVAYLKQILKLLSAAVGAVIMLMLVIAGIQYITSTGQPEQIKQAKTRIINAITALVLFLMTFAIMNFLIPGGLFS